MKNKPKPKIITHVSVRCASSADLKGKQSVRTTFKLSERTINAVSIVASQLGIRQKSLFDHLMEDMQVLETIANQIQEMELPVQPRVQKTYVISRKSLTCLERIAREHQASRDALVEFSVQRLLPLIEQEKEKHIKRKAILKDLARYVVDGKKLLAKSREILGEDDPVSEELEAAIAVCENTYQDIDSLVEKGKVIENF